MGELLVGGAWCCVGASVAGVSHERTGQACQDAFAYKVLADGTMIAAVADGAGSAEFGESGARAATQAAVEVLTAALENQHPTTYPVWVKLFQELVSETQQRIAQKAKPEARSSRDFAATLLVVAATPTQIVCGSVGDCAAVMLDQQGKLSSLCPPQRGEYANATHFITSQDALSHLSVRIRKLTTANSVANLALFTDGLLELAINVAHNRPFEPFFQPLFSFINDVVTNGEAEAAADLAAFLDSERVNSRTHDDKTLLLLRSLGT